MEKQTKLRYALMSYTANTSAGEHEFIAENWNGVTPRKGNYEIRDKTSGNLIFTLKLDFFQNQEGSSGGGSSGGAGSFGNPIDYTNGNPFGHEFFSGYRFIFTLDGNDYVYDIFHNISGNTYNTEADVITQLETVAGLTNPSIDKYIAVFDTDQPNNTTGNVEIALVSHNGEYRAYLIKLL